MRLHHHHRSIFAGVSQAQSSPHCLLRRCGRRYCARRQSQAGTGGFFFLFGRTWHLVDLVKNREHQSGLGSLIVMAGPEGAIVADSALWCVAAPLGGLPGYKKLCRVKECQIKPSTTPKLQNKSDPYQTNGLLFLYLQRQTLKTAMKVVILAIIIVAICFCLLLGVKVLFVRGGRFPSGHTHSAAFRSRGIGCAWNRRRT